LSPRELRPLLKFAATAVPHVILGHGRILPSRVAMSADRDTSTAADICVSTFAARLKQIGGRFRPFKWLGHRCFPRSQRRFRYNRRSISDPLVTSDLMANENPPPRPTQIAIAVVECAGRYLIGQRPAGVPLAGLWEFPGGKIKPGETP